MDGLARASADMDATNMLRDSAAAIVPLSGDLGRVRKLRFAAPGYDPATWRAMCKMGWAGLLADEGRGGSALGMLAAVALLEEMGAGLVPEPLLPAMTAAAVLPETRAADVIDGGRLVVPALDHASGPVSVTAAGLFGHRTGVLAADAAAAFLIEAEGRLYLVERTATELRVESQGTLDGGFAGTLHLDGIPATPIEADAGAMNDQAALLLSGYLLGVARRALAITIDYVKIRHQFGKAIASFQAIQHKLADQHVQLALCRASVEAAALRWDEGGMTETERAIAVSRAKVRAIETANLVTRQAIQLHGAIGFTDEAPIGLFVRKAAVLMNIFGSTSYHRARYGRLVGADGAAGRPV